MESCLHPCKCRHGHERPFLHGSIDWSEQVEEICQWAKSVAELGKPQFGEFLMRLKAVRNEIHQACRDAECRCSPCRGGSCGSVSSHPLIGAAEVEPMPDVRLQILARLDAMIKVLHCEDTCFTSWQSACRRFDEIYRLIPRPQTRKLS